VCCGLVEQVGHVIDTQVDHWRLQLGEALARLNRERLVAAAIEHELALHAQVDIAAEQAAEVRAAQWHGQEVRGQVVALTRLRRYMLEGCGVGHRVSRTRVRRMARLR